MDSFSVDEQAVVTAQSTIGWKHILFGRLSLEWNRVQDEHVAKEKLDAGKYSGTTWITQVTKNISGNNSSPFGFVATNPLTATPMKKTRQRNAPVLSL
jgi:hypothetical protein